MVTPIMEVQPLPSPTNFLTSCRSPKGSKQTKANSKTKDKNMNQDPLSVDLMAVDTSFPMLAPDNYQLRIIKSEIKPTADGKANLISVEMETTAVATDVKGQQVPPGVKVFDRVMLAPTGKATQEIVNRGIASLVQAAALTGSITLATVPQWVKQLEGKLVLCKVGIEPESTNQLTGKRYQAKNVVDQYVKQ